MTLLGYYGQVALPILTVMIIGSLLLFAVRRRSAATKQYICAATLLCGLAVGLVPFLPLSARPVLPGAIPKMIFLKVSPYETVVVDFGSGLAPKSSQTPIDYLAILTGLVLVVTLALMARLFGSLIAVYRLRRSSEEASERIQSFTKREIRLVESLSSPAAVGGLKPIILLPVEAENWTDDQLQAVIIHEEAHLDNNDPNWQLVAELSCILYWFNPLVWFVRGLMRQAAERAADDAVIRAGIQPSTYAQELFDIASSIGRTRQPIAWTTFARQNGVKGRIKAILNSRIERNPMNKPAKLFSMSGLAVAAYCTSAYVGNGQAISTSGFKDIREGKTISAAPGNGFVGKMADGREVEVVQISRQLDNGSIVAWKPDGTPIEPNKVFKHRYHPLKTLNTHTRYVLIKFPDVKGGTEPNAGCGSPDRYPKPEPSMTVYAGGGNVAHKDGYCYTVSYIGLPKEDSPKFSVMFSTSDSSHSDLGPVDISNPAFKKVSITEVTQPKKGDLEDNEWWKNHKAPYTMVEYVIPAASPETVPDSNLLPVFFDSKRVHKEANEYGNFGGYIQNPPENRIEGFQGRYYFAYPKSMIKEFRYKTRTSSHCNIFEMSSDPNAGKP